MLQQKSVVTRIREARELRPEEIPAIKFQVAAVVLNESIRRALADPQQRADFERWRERRRAEENQS